MKSRFARMAAVVVLVLSVVAVGAAASPAAHEDREIGGYTIVVGWRVEPAYTGLLNGPEIVVTRAAADDHHEHDEATEEADTTHGHSNDGADTHTAEGIAGLEDTLQIEVIFGPASRVLNLRAVRGEPGHYTADLIPTRAGDYTFRVFGTIDGTDVDETFSAADGLFSSVEPVEDIQFP